MRRNAALLVLISVLSGFGGTALVLAAGVWIFDLTGNPGLAALAALGVYLPSLAAPWLGALVDRFPRRGLLITVEFVVAALLLALLPVDSAGQVWLIYLVMLARGFGYVLLDAGETAMLPSVLPARMLGDVNGWRSSGQEGMKLLAPLAGAGLYAWAGPHPVVLLCAALPLLSALCYALLRRHIPASEPATVATAPSVGSAAVGPATKATEVEGDAGDGKAVWSAEAVPAAGTARAAGDAGDGKAAWGAETVLAAGTSGVEGDGRGLGNAEAEPAVAAAGDAGAGPGVAATGMARPAGVVPVVGVRAEAGEEGRERRVGLGWASVREGLVVLGREPLRTPVLVATVAIAVAGLTNAAVLSRLVDGLHLPATYLGVLSSAQGGGSIVAGLLVGRLLGRMSAARVAAVGAVIFAVACVARIVPWWPSMILGSVLTGIGLVWALIAAVTAIQTGTPEHLLGRVAATGNTAMFGPQALTIPLGAAMIALGDQVTLGVGAVLILVTVLLVRRSMAPRVTV